MRAFDERRILARHVEAARSDVPSAAELESVLGALGSPGVMADGASQAPSAAKTSALVKLAGRGLLAVALAGGAVAALRESRVAATAPAPSPPRAEPATPPVVESAPEPVMDTRSSVAIREPDAPRAAPRRPRVATTTPATHVMATPDEPSPGATASVSFPAEAASAKEAPARSLDAEANLVDAARKAVHGDPARTLSLAAEHARTFPSGLLTLEREALAIHALVLLGRKAEARQRFEQFERAHPRSVHVARLRALLGERSDPGR